MAHAEENRRMLRLLRSGEGREEEGQTPDDIRNGLDWDYILKTARRNAIAGLLYHNLRGSSIQDRVPAPVMKELARTCHATGFLNAMHQDELERILPALEERGIEAVVLKGAALSAEIPRLRKTRYMSDLDLMVREKDLPSADAAFLELGYVSSEGYRTKDWFFEKHHHLAPYCKPGTNLKAELHRSIIPMEAPFQLDMDLLWTRSRRVQNGSFEMRVLSPQDTLVYLCLHLSWAHAFTGALRCFTDIASCLECHRHSIDWDSVVQTARMGDCATYVYYPLFFANRTLDLRLPESLLKELKGHSHLGRVEDYLFRMLIRRYRIFENSSSSFLPTWFLEKLCKELLRPAPLHKKILCIGKIVLCPAPEKHERSTPPDSSRLSTWLDPGGRLLRMARKLASRLNEVVMKKVSSGTP